MEKRIRRTIERELPAVGTKLNGKFMGITYKAKIVADKSGSIGKAVEYAGTKYGSMSAAARAITKQPTNGWRFWHIQVDK
jgi:hypothetical protein